MALTRDFRLTVKARAEKDAAFRAALYREAVQAIVDGDLATGKALLRDFINATLGFAPLARRLALPEKSLMRMLGPKGNPRAANLVAVLGLLGTESGVSLAVRAKPQPRDSRQAAGSGGTPITRRTAPRRPAGTGSGRAAARP